uniref:Type I polyketide synthase n=1 Tax=Gambierdiscus polynesiensis TaxID=439318 RepID=A0A1S6K844_9DINO|nr:type I polyketide synthase [Gambierdiscus polynesiensis]
MAPSGAASTEGRMYKDGAMYQRAAFEGSLVEIHGLAEELEPTPETRVQNPNALPVTVNGERGRVIGWSDQDEKYIVETFDGLVIGVGSGNLVEYEPPATEDGGFDLAWPSGPVSHDEFADGVVGTLQDKGYCVVQMFSSAAMRSAAVAEASELTDWRLPTAELEVAYLGSGNTSKYAVLAQDDFSREPDDRLAQCDRVLSNLGILLRGSLLDGFGFSIDGRTNGNVCVPLANASEEKLLRPSPLAHADEEAQQKIHGHVNFLQMRRVKAMYTIENEGGQIEVLPNVGEGPAVSLPLSKNRLVILLPDRVGYRYQPEGKSLMLQTWFMSEPAIVGWESKRSVRIPQRQRDERVHLKSLHVRIPGGGCDRMQAWAMWAAGTDGALKIPSNRFDIDLYYNPEAQFGALYTNHSAVMADYYMDHFDYQHFGIREVEASSMGAGQRNLLEVGYESFYQAGYTRESMRGLHAGVYIGDKNTDRKSLVPGIVQAKVMMGGEVLNCHHSGFNSGVTACRLSYSFTLRGPVADIDTACSSALVAMGEANKGLRRATQENPTPTAYCGLRTALVMGMDLVDAPFTLFAYCAAQMVSVGGRSFTFDESANGFLRGDGVGGTLLELGTSDEEAQEMLACLMGTNVNQDGKSASLSAPHGPSQQQCIKASMSEAGLTASEITIAECHGTGTALGDPIEVGALRETMKKRDVPMVVTSAKSNFGHTEAAAGICGIARCMTMLLSMCGACNLHLKNINPHIEYIGYPAFFITESTDCGKKTGISGVSSFGVGGTNARGDIWSRSVYGYMRTDTVLPVNKWRLQTALHMRIHLNGQPGPSVSDTLSLYGSWNGWSEMVEMESVEDGTWEAIVVLGDVGRERFCVVLNGNPRAAFYPMVDWAAQSEEILGPDWEREQRCWLIQGTAEKARYKIKFTWSFSYEKGELKTVTWELLDNEGPDPPPAAVDGWAYEHSYALAASWTGWERVRMHPGSGKEKLFETTVRIGASGQEEFQFVRDGDWKQAIHPAAAKTTKAMVPVRGPDDDNQKAWVIVGKPGQVFTVQLEISNTLITVRTISPKLEKKIWLSRDVSGVDWHDYWVVFGSFDPQFIPLAPDPKLAGVYRCTITTRASGKENFQIAVDHDLSLILHPSFGGARSGESEVFGPDDAVRGFFWTISGRPDSTYEVVLERSRDSSSVAWREIAAIELVDSGALEDQQDQASDNKPKEAEEEEEGAQAAESAEQEA